jgi:hypothetical protein
MHIHIHTYIHKYIHTCVRTYIQYIHTVCMDVDRTFFGFSVILRVIARLSVRFLKAILFVHAYAQLYLVLNNLVFQNSSRVFGGRFSSMYIGVVLFVSSFMILFMVRSLSVLFLKASRTRSPSSQFPKSHSFTLFPMMFIIIKKYSIC